MAVYFSFHYQRDHWRVQQIINMGQLAGQPILSAQEWEAVKKKGDAAIEKWIADEMSGKSAVVVLVGKETAGRKWVQHEITKAWNDKKPLVGIRIHGLADKDGHTDTRGANPFELVTLKGGGTVGDYVKLHDPAGSTSKDVYKSIEDNITDWVKNAYKRS